MIFNICNKISIGYNILRFKFIGINYGSKLRVSGIIGIVNDGICRIGNHFVCTSGTMANPMGRNIRSYIKVSKNAVLTIGDETGMSSSCIRCSKSITIGSYVKIGANVIITDTDAHSLDWRLRRDYRTDAEYAKSVPIVIGDDVFIGVNSIICKGVTIGDRSVIGAGSVVTKSIPPDEIWAGNPARFVKSLK